MVALWIVAIGGACGSLLRYVISEFVTRLSAGIFPWGTMSVNLIGSFAIGVVWQLVENGSLSPNARLFLISGFMGAFTTFSTFTLENVHLLQGSNYRLFLYNILVKNIIGICLVAMGMAVCRHSVSLFKA